jgi:hypothetical protein
MNSTSDQDQQAPGDSSEKKKRKNLKWTLIKWAILLGKLVWRVIQFFSDEE